MWRREERGGEKKHQVRRKLHLWKSLLQSAFSFHKSRTFHFTQSGFKLFFQRSFLPSPSSLLPSSLLDNRVLSCKECKGLQRQKLSISLFIIGRGKKAYFPLFLCSNSFYQPQIWCHCHVCPYISTLNLQMKCLEITTENKSGKKLLKCWKSNHSNIAVLVPV